MTLTAVWANYEQDDAPCLWMASDSRISDGATRLVDEGIKLFEIPYVCVGPGEDGFFDRPYHAGTVGMAAAGGTLVFQHVYGTAVSVLGQLNSVHGRVPTLREIADLVGRITTTYARSLGQSRPGGAQVSLVVGGQRPGQDPQAFELSPALDEAGLIFYPARPLDLSPGRVHFNGDQVATADSLLEGLRSSAAPGIADERAPLTVIRRLIDDPAAVSIGGQVQIGYSSSRGRFRRVASVVVRPGHAPQALRLLNSIDLDDLGSVGPCAIGIDGMISP